jgi:alpha-L-arabinofuranosidase
MSRTFRLFVFALLGPAAFGATTIDVSNQIVVPAVKRFGINLGWANNYDSGQIMKNLVFRNPGFEGLIDRSIVRCVSGTPTGFVDENPNARWPTSFWNGASYEVIVGGAKGRAGTVLASTAPSGGGGTRFELADAGVAPAAGDYILLRKSETGGATSGWLPATSGGGLVTDETIDLASDTQGHQAVRLTAMGSGQTARLQAVFDSSVAGPFVQLNGTFRLSFKAKGAGGSNTIGIFLGRGTPANLVFLNRNVALSSSWTTYTLDFAAAENGTSRGPVQLGFILASPAAALLDDVSLTQVNGDPANSTVFRDPVVQALKGLNPGILRYWVEDLGDSLDNEIAPPFARQRANYSSQVLVREDLLYGLEEFLELCDAVRAEPWYVVPSTFSPQEMANLVEYLGGPVSSPYGAKRAARGHTTPWTDAMPVIHLEFGNEAWNNVDYYGGTISDPQSYGARGSELFAAAKASPWYIGSKFDLVLGSQAALPARSAAIHNASANHDSLAVAPYFGGTIDSFASDEELFGPLFAEPEMLSQTGFMRQTFTNMQASSRPVPLSVYEVNLHTTGGAITQAALDSFTPSAGAGVAVADHMLMMLRDLGIRNQCLYSLTQFASRRRDGQYVLLWSVVRDMGVTDRKRPQYLTLALANEAVSGDLVRTTLTGDDPTWNQPLVNGVRFDNAHRIQTYAFSRGNHRAIVVFNLDRSQPLQVTFTGPNAPAGATTIRQLNAPAITATNETSENVTITTRDETAFDPAQPLTLPPYSMTVLSNDRYPLAPLGNH